MAQIEINGGKLRELMFEKGVKPSTASTQAGFASNYWKNAMTRGACSETAANLLFMQFGINLIDYRADAEPDTIPFDEPTAPEEPEERTAAEPEPVIAETVVSMRDEIREGVLDAIYQLLGNSETADIINKIIYNAVKGAIINADRIIKG